MTRLQETRSSATKRLPLLMPDKHLGKGAAVLGNTVLILAEGATVLSDTVLVLAEGAAILSNTVLVLAEGAAVLGNAVDVPVEDHAGESSGDHFCGWVCLSRVDLEENVSWRVLGI